MLSVSVECTKCKGVVVVNEFSLNKEKVNFVEDGKRISLSYSECKKCKEHCVVELNDDETLAIAEEMKANMKTMYEARIRGIQLTKRKIESFKMKDKELQYKRKALEMRYDGKEYFDSNGELKVLSMSDRR